MDHRHAVTTRWTPRSEVASVSDPYTYAVPGLAGSAPMSHFEVVEVTYLDGTMERVPVEDMHLSSADRSDIPHLVSFAVGVPTALLMVLLAFDDAFGPRTLLLAAPSACGCAVAVAGLRSPARRLRVAALVLTLVPAAVVLAWVAAAVVFYVVVILGSSNPNS